MKTTLFLVGPTDRDAQTPPTRERLDGAGWKFTADFSGALPILPFVMSDRTLSANSHIAVVGVHDIELSRTTDVNLFNLVGDADASGQSLHAINGIANQIQPSRHFNAPNYVYRTSRARLQKTLANVPGCVVPRTEAADPKTFEELQAACRGFGSWPIIVRARGFHGGKHMMLLTEERQLESIKDLAWPYNGIFLIQHVDCRNDEGLYHKIRVVMVDGTAYARQCVYSDQWAIHAGSRADLMDHDMGLCRQEEGFLAQLRDKGLRERDQLFEKIYQRVELDIFGIDFALVDNKVIIFEANACMHFLGRGNSSNSRYAYLDCYKKELRRAVKKMLVRA